MLLEPKEFIIINVMADNNFVIDISNQERKPFFSEELKENIYSMLPIGKLNKGSKSKDSKRDILITPFSEKEIFLETRNDNFHPHKKPVKRAIKFRIYPDKRQKEFLLLQEKGFDYFYNLTVNIINAQMDEVISKFRESNHCCVEGCLNERYQKKSGEILFRCLDCIKESKSLNYGIERDHSFYRDNLFQIEKIPEGVYRAVADNGIREALSAFSSSIARKRKFRLKYRENKNEGSFWLQRIAFKIEKGKILLTKRSSEMDHHLFTREEVNIETTSAARILRKNSNYYICLIKKENPKRSEQTNKIISLDPGIRTPFTGYDLQNQVEYGLDSVKKAKKIFKRIDFFNSINNSKAKRKSQRAQHRLNGVISNFQNQAINHLTKNYDEIYLPTFETSEMVQKDVIGKGTKRMMNALSFFKFKEKLKNKCYDRCKLLFIVDESYTSKTCPECGNIHSELKGEKIFKCPNCCLSIPRDLNAARNILARSLSYFRH